MDAAAKRVAALRRFAVTLTAFNLLGHLYFGFEQSYAQPLAALATAYGLELSLDLIDAGLYHRRPAFIRGPIPLIDFLLPGHITALATAMLLYANSEIWPIVFGTAVAVGSKHLFRMRVGPGTRHIFNPSNFGISLTLLAFPWVGIAPPYHFTENLHGVADWVLPALILASGGYLNARLTGRIPLLLGWTGAFVAQALLRTMLFGAYLPSALGLMTSVVFVLYTFYMVTDPATTPVSTRAQVAFGATVAGTYGLLVAFHVVFGLFFALTIVCGLRGLVTYAYRLTAGKTANVAQTHMVPRTAPRALQVR